MHPYLCLDRREDRHMFRRKPPCLVLSALVLSCVSPGGCARRPPPEPGRYHSKEKGFSIRLPKEWERREGIMGTTVIALSPQEGPADQFRENVNVFVEELPRTISLEEYSTLSLANLRKLMTDFQELGTGEAVIGKATAVRRISSYRMGQFSLKALAYSLVKGRRAYVITCSSEAEQFDTYLGKFEDIAESFRLE